MTLLFKIGTLAFGPTTAVGHSRQRRQATDAYSLRASGLLPTAGFAFPDGFDLQVLT